MAATDTAEIPREAPVYHEGLQAVNGGGTVLYGKRRMKEPTQSQVAPASETSTRLSVAVESMPLAVGPTSQPSAATLHKPFLPSLSYTKVHSHSLYKQQEHAKHISPTQILAQTNTLFKQSVWDHADAPAVTTAYVTLRKLQKR